MATPFITLVGQLLNLFGVGDSGSLVIQLAGFGSSAPRVVGTGMLAPTAPIAVQTDAEGNFNFELWSNAQITPAGTYYTILIQDDGGNAIQLNAYQFLDTVPHGYDLSSVAPFIVIPVPPNPSRFLLLNPPGAATQTIVGSIVIEGDLTVTGAFSFSPGMYVVPFSGGNPVFNGDFGWGQDLTLTGNVAASTAINFVAGAPLTFVIRQDATGGRTFVWPANFVEPPQINDAPNGTTCVTFMKSSVDGKYYATGTAVWTGA